MFSQVLKTALIFLTMVSVAQASGGGAHGEAQGEAHGEAAEGAAAETPKEVKSNEESFSVVLARVQGLEAKVRSAEEDIKKLIQEKHHAKDNEKANEVIRQMISVHRELEHNVKEYDQQRALLNYRYPEKGQAGKRHYERIEVKSIEEMEGQMSLSNSVKKTLKKVRTQYEISAPQRSDKLNAEAENSGKKVNVKGSQPSLIDPVILKK